MSALSSTIKISSLIYFKNIILIFEFSNWNKSIFPLWSLTILFTIDNPKPVPFFLVVNTDYDIFNIIF